MQSASTPKAQSSSSPAPVTPVGPRRSQRVVHQPERTLSSYKTTPTYASAKSVPTASTHAAAHAPGNPVPAPPQAQMSSYVSRMRTGSTLLMQPISTSSHAAAAASLALNAMGAQRRRGGVINYAEGLSDDDFGDSEDDEEFTKDKNGAGGSKRSTPRLGSGPGSSSFRVGSPASGTPQREVRQELDKSYLGLIPPSRYFSSKPVSKSRHDYPSAADTLKIAQTKEILIPIRIDLDTDTHRIRDCFTWNLNEDFITPETFARIFCQDLELPPVPYVDQVSGAIRAQIEEHAGIASFQLESDSEHEQEDGSDHEHDQGSDNETADAQQRSVRKRPRNDRVAALSRRSRTATPGHDSTASGSGSGRAGTEAPEEPEQVDCRVLLSLDVQINKYHLLDTIEWDLAPAAIASAPPLPPHISNPPPSLSTPTPSPFFPSPESSAISSSLPDAVLSRSAALPPSTVESFARTLSSDLGLHGEAVPLIAHALHEELLKHKKDAIEWGVLLPPLSSSHVHDLILNPLAHGNAHAHGISARQRARNPLGPRPLRGVWRDWNEVGEFGPRLEVMSQEEMERREVERERIARRLRRDTSKYVKAAGRKRR